MLLVSARQLGIAQQSVQETESRLPAALSTFLVAYAGGKKQVLFSGMQSGCSQR